MTKTMHAYLDYPVAFSLIVLPFVLGLGASHPAAKWLGVGTGVAALLLTVLTDHQFGLVRIIPYPVHVAVDALVGVTFAIAPFALGFQGIDALYYWLNASAVLLVVSLNQPEGAGAQA